MSRRITECPHYGKHVHESKGKALAHLRRLKDSPRPYRGDPNAYYCPWCKGWHVGHKKPYAKKKNRKAAR